MKDTRIALVTCTSPVNRIEHNLATIARWTAAAAEENAAIVCFPELSVSGYSTKSDAELLSEPVPGPITRQFLKIAAENGVVLLAGMAEENSAGRVFASHVVVSPERILGVYRKLHIAPPERQIFSQGEQAPLFEYDGLKFGIQLCYDAHFPELATRMAADGADLIFMPHASPRATPQKKYNSWMRHLTARAFDNSVFIAACNQVGDNQMGLSFSGVAAVIGPSGLIQKKKLSDEESMLVCTLKAKDLSNVRNHPMRYFLPNRRPEIYGL